MDDLIGRLLPFTVWGLGALVIWGAVLYRARRRPLRELAARFALFLTALASAASVFMVLFGPAGNGARAGTVAVALGAFIVAGIVMLFEPD